MKAKLLKDSIYVSSEKQNLIYKLKQVPEQLSVTVEIVDSLPEDGEEIFAGDILVLSVLDNLSQMTKQLADEAVNSEF